MENAGYLFATYAIIWALFFGFLIFLYMRQRRLNRELDSLKKMVEKQTSEK